MNAPYQAFQTEDGWITLGAANQKNWERLTDLIDAAHLKDDPRFLTNAKRMNNRLELEEILNGIFRQKTSREWLQLLHDGNFPAGPVSNVREMHDDPHTVARQMVVETEHPVAGETKAIGLPVKFSATPGEVSRPAPLKGQHAEEILRTAGYDENEIDALFNNGGVLRPSV